MIDDETVLKPGAMIADYRIDKVLGAGNFGVTYLARDVQLDRQVAIKEYMPRDYARRDTAGTIGSRNADTENVFSWGLDRFSDEARTLAQFKHPNIVGVQRLVPGVNGTAYIAMDWIEGVDLEKFVETNGPLPADQFTSIFRQLLDGVAAIHAIGILHRDIKPSNILLSGEVPILVDFGAARDLSLQRKAGFSAIVTDGYSPLEQYSRDQQQSEASDIYALAATAHYLLSKDIPPSPTARIAGDELAPTAHLAPALPEDIARGIDWGLSLKVGDRPASIADWRAAMPSLVPDEGGRGEVVTEVVYVDREGGPRLDRRALLLIGGGAVATLGIGSFLLFGDSSVSNSATPLKAQWTRDLAPLYGEPFAGIAVTADGVLVAAHELGADGNERALAVRYDDSGKETGRFLLDEPGSRAHAVLPAKDGGAFVAGEVGTQSVIVRLGPDFRVKWRQGYQPGSISSLMARGDDITAGLEGPEGSGSAKLLLIEAASGNVASEVVLLDRQGDSVQRVIPVAEGATAVLGRRLEERVVKGERKKVASLWVAKVAASGEELWRVSESGQGSAEGWDLVESGGEIFVTGRTIDLASGTGRMLALRISRDGQKKWARWDYPEDVGSGRGLAVTGGKGGPLYLASWARTPQRARLSQVGPSGDLVWDEVDPGNAGYGDAYSGIVMREDGTGFAVRLRSKTVEDLALSITRLS
jgi:hypothetical protein